MIYTSILKFCSINICKHKILCYLTLNFRDYENKLFQTNLRGMRKTYMKKIYAWFQILVSLLISRACDIPGQY